MIAARLVAWARDAERWQSEKLDATVLFVHARVAWKCSCLCLGGYGYGYGYSVSEGRKR